MSSGHRIIWWVVIAAIAIVFELNALGKFGTAAGKINTKFYDSHRNAIWMASGLAVGMYLLAGLLMRA